MIATPSAGKRRPGRPPASEIALTKERVLRVAREVFSEVGYERATFEEIARRAGITRPAVKHYFDGKEALFHALITSVREEVVESSATEAEQHDLLPDRLKVFLEMAAQVDAKDRTYARFMTASLLDAFRYPEIREHGQEQIDDIRQFLGRWFAEACSTGHISPDADQGALTEMLVAVFWGMGFYAGFVGDHEQLESVIDQFGQLLGRL